MKILRRITALAAAVCAMLCYVSAAFAVRTSPGLISGEFYYCPSGSSYEYTDRFYYSDGYFSVSGKSANEHLRTMSLVLALTASKAEKVSALFGKIGFSLTDIAAEDMDGEPTRDTIGTVISHKSTAEGEIIAVAVRGSGYDKEWADNFDLGYTGDAEGFSHTAKKVVERIKTYEKRYALSGAKLWITGFSRGGAVADLTGKYINGDPDAFGVTADDLYVYTFEAPAASSEHTGYENIRNVVNPNDIIPLVYPAQWGFSNSGVTEMLPADEIRIHRKEFSLSISEGIGLKNRYDLIPAASNWEFPKKELSPPITVSAFERSFIAWMSSGTSREEFAKYSRSISDLLAVFAFRSIDEYAMLAEFVGKTMKELFKAANIPFILSIAYLDPGDEAYESSLDALSGLFADALDKTGRCDILSEEEFAAVKCSVPNVIRFALPLIKEDLSGDHKLEYFGTLIGNIGTIFAEHYLQNVFEIVKSTDSYYNSGNIKASSVSEGTLSDSTDRDRNYMNAALVSGGDELISAVLTDMEWRRWQLGDNVIVKLGAAEGIVREEDREALSNALKVFGSGSGTGGCIRLSLSKKVGNTVRERTADVSVPVTVVINVPDKLLKTDSSFIREFDVVSLHGGTADILPSRYDKSSGRVLFETGNFASCVLVYRDRPASDPYADDPNPKTGVPVSLDMTA